MKEGHAGRLAQDEREAEIWAYMGGRVMECVVCVWAVSDAWV